MLYFLTSHPFRVSRLTVYTQSIFCYTLLVSNTALDQHPSKNRGYSNKLLGHKLLLQYINPMPGTGWVIHTQGARHSPRVQPGPHIAVLASMELGGDPHVFTFHGQVQSVCPCEISVGGVVGYCHEDPYPGSNPDAVAWCRRASTGQFHPCRVSYWGRTKIPVGVGPVFQRGDFYSIHSPST